MQAACLRPTYLLDPCFLYAVAPYLSIYLSMLDGIAYVQDNIGSVTYYYVCVTVTTGRKSTPMPDDN
jgi:hypothetical protein